MTHHDTSIGTRSNITKTFTSLKQFSNTTHRLSYLDKSIRIYVKYPMWNAEAFIANTKKWGNPEYPLYNAKPGMWHSTDYIESTSKNQYPLTFIMGQLCFRHPDEALSA